MISDTLVVNKYVKGYLYEVQNKVKIPIITDKLRMALYECDVAEHSFFTILPNYIEVSANYAWDGATGVINNTQDLIVPSLIHDIGCQSVNVGLLPFKIRKHFDREYYEQSLLYGTNPIRALAHYSAISLWGMIPKDKKLDNKITHYEIELKCK